MRCDHFPENPMNKMSRGRVRPPRATVLMAAAALLASLPATAQQAAPVVDKGAVLVKPAAGREQSEHWIAHLGSSRDAHSIALAE